MKQKISERVKAQGGSSTSNMKVEASSSKSGFREPGWRRLDSTAAFRAVNPELFIKPNKVVMSIGVAAIVGCVAYIGYLNLKTDKTKETYLAINEKDELQRHYRTSRWD
ncbi:hypothetical protein LSH36_39g09066 [Paralvinella palmiformis]|uniref:Small integral membrane protein 8 n=1 Tax=Paralvinella palmiformis TaxID=53620 RepID=A0AAD9K7N6_9ANNE|nr:hypothetical protein LSH36_39g09066 [Paralvinella palmiformis]